MDPKVFDMHGNEKNFAWANSVYGVEFREWALSGPKFALKVIREREGAAVFSVAVRNAAGGPQAGQPIAYAWPDPNLSDLTQDPNLKTVWERFALVENTEANGCHDFGFGGGSVIKGGGGPHTFWVLSPTLPSDGLAKVGWLGSTNHRGMLVMEFEITDEEVPEPDPDPDPGLDQYTRCLDKAETIADGLAMGTLAAEHKVAADIYLRIARTLTLE